MADSRTLNLVLKLQDQTSKELGKVKGKLDELQPAFRKMAAVGTVAFTAIGTATFKMTQTAIDAQEVFNKFDVVFKDVSDQAEAVAQDLRSNFGLAESSAKDLLSATGDMLTGFGLSGEAALDLAEKTNKLAVDLASFTNIEGGAERASKALTKALLGERESVKELGIAIMEEDVQAKIEAMKATGKFTNETERQMKAMATLEIAYEQSKNAIGDFARTQDSAANMQRVLKERMKELSETMGATFVPILEAVLPKIMEITEGIRKWVQENPELARNIIIAVAAITGLVAVVGLLGIALSILWSPITLIVLGIGLLVAGAVWLATKWGEIAEWLVGLWEGIKNVFMSAIQWIIENTLFGLMIKSIMVVMQNWDQLVAKAKSIWEAIKTTFKSAVDWILSKALDPLKAKIDGIVESLRSAWEFMKEMGGKVSSGVKGAISKITGRASGGPVSANTPYIVGERGAELFVPSQSGTIVPNLAGVGGGGITINVYGDVSGQEIVDKVRNALAMDIKRSIRI